MNEINADSCVDPMIRFKHQSLMQDYHELRKETEFKMRKLEMMTQKRLTLYAEVRFLRRRYKHLKQDQTHEISPEMLRLSESRGLEVTKKPSGKREKQSSLRVSVPCLKQKHEKQALISNASFDLEKNPKRSKGNKVSTNSTSLPDLNGDGNTIATDKVSGFDLNQISREEEEPEANGAHMVVEGAKKAMLGNIICDLNGEMKLPIFRDVDKELNRAVKRKVTWQDPVALSV